MIHMCDTFESNGYVIIDKVLSDLELAEVNAGVSFLSLESAGTRNVLDSEWCREVANSLRSHPAIFPFLPLVC